MVPNTLKSPTKINFMWNITKHINCIQKFIQKNNTLKIHNINLYT